MNYLKWMSFCFMALCFTGCAHKAMYRFGELAQATNITIVDARRDEDRLATNPCQNGGVSNIGDKYIEPSKLGLLQSRLGKAFTTAEPIEIVVTRFNILLIVPDSCERAKDAARAGAIAGAIGVAIIQSRARAEKEGVYCELTYRMKGKDYKGEAFLAAQNAINSLNGIQVSTDELITPIVRTVDACITGSLRKK